jgi:hypothetical protein
MDQRAADRLAGNLRASGHDARVQRLNFFMHVVWAKPAERPAPPVTAAGRAGASPKPAYQGAAAEVLGPPIPAHEAVLLLAEPGGRLRPEFMDWEGDLPLEPGSLVPVWYPRKVDGEELNAEQRNAQFRFDLALLLASHCPTTPASGPPAMHVESDCTAHDVLRALLELRSVWRQE